VVSKPTVESIVKNAFFVSAFFLVVCLRWYSEDVLSRNKVRPRVVVVLISKIQTSLVSFVLYF
jgi:hypothetical protein